LKLFAFLLQNNWFLKL